MVITSHIKLLKNGKLLCKSSPWEKTQPDIVPIMQLSETASET